MKEVGSTPGLKETKKLKPWTKVGYTRQGKTRGKGRGASSAGSVQVDNMLLRRAGRKMKK